MCLSKHVSTGCLRYMFVMEEDEFFLFSRHGFSPEPFFLSSLGNLLLTFRARASWLDKLFGSEFFLHAKRSYFTLHLQKRRVAVTIWPLFCCIVGRQSGVVVCHVLAYALCMPFPTLAVPACRVDHGRSRCGCPSSAECTCVVQAERG